MERGCSSGLVVTTASPGELDEAYEVERASFDNPYTRGFFEVLYALSSDLFLAAKQCGRIVGYAAAVRLGGPVCHLASIAVAPHARGQRVGAALLASIEHLCASEGRHAIVLEVEFTNIAAQRLYASMGYKPLRMLPNYYGLGRHGVAMIKVLDDP